MCCRTAKEATGAAVVLITHDLGVVAGFADRVAVMYAGRIVEIGDVDDVFYRPRMPYTLGLLGSIPRLDVGRRQRLTPIEGSPPSLVHLPVRMPVLAAVSAAHPEVRRGRAGAAADSGARRRRTAPPATAATKSNSGS